MTVAPSERTASVRRLLAFVCLANLCTVLTLGLWPFHSPKNNVAWALKGDGLRFGRFGTVISSGVFPESRTGEASMEMWLQLKTKWQSGTLLAFYSPGHPYQFSLRQSQTDLVLRTEGKDRKPVLLYAAGVFSELRPVFISVTAGAQGVFVYADGVRVLRTSSFPLTAQNFSGILILGDAPAQTDAWSGEMLEVALYEHQMTAVEVSRDFAAWQQKGGAEITGYEQAIALYRFDERAGNVVHNRVNSSLDLIIPETYKIVDKIFLEPFWTEFSTSWNYWGAVLKNIIGFIPFGFCFYAWLITLLPTTRASTVTVLLGAAASLTIEILQAFLPTRESGTTDLITNTLGTWIGTVGYRFVMPILMRFFPSLPVRRERTGRSCGMF